VRDTDHLRYLLTAFLKDLIMYSLGNAGAHSTIGAFAGGNSSETARPNGVQFMRVNWFFIPLNSFATNFPAYLMVN
jgi:hypothetical protein